MSISQSLFQFIEQKISPFAARLSSQRHVMAVRDGFISAMPFMIVGSFLLVFVHPPFSPESSWEFARSWLALSAKYELQILTPFNMTMGIMSIYIAASIAYNLARSYKLDPFMTAMLSLMSFLLVAAPQVDKKMSTEALGGVGIFTAILVAIYVTELTRLLKKYNIGIRLPEQVPSNIKHSFDLLIPIIAVVITLFPISLLVQSGFDMLLPQAIMALFEPLISAADSLPAILVAVLICHLLWFAGIHGSAIVSGMLQAFWLTNQTALAAGLPMTHIMTEAFWNFLIVIGGSGATIGLVLLFCRSKSAHLRTMGKLSLVPSCFNINEPVIFGTPIVMNPVFFIPFLLAPMVNAVIAYLAVSTDLLPHMISLVPWTSPAPIGAAWAMGWDFKVSILVIMLMALSMMIYYPFFKVYEKQLLTQEKAAEADEVFTKQADAAN